MSRRKDWASDPEVRVVRTHCGTCHCECGCLAYVKDGRVIHLEGDPDHVQNEGGFCPKGSGFLEYEYHPDRLLYPLKRAGERGEGKWERISWDQAITEITDKMKQLIADYGAHTITWGIGDGDRDNNLCNLAWLFGIGSPMQFGDDSAYCLRPATIADKCTWGQSNTWEVGPDFSRTKLAICWGANPMEAHLVSKGRELLRGLDNGARLLVIDPRLSKTACRADLWLQVRPATDAALALGLANFIIEHGLYNRKFVEEQTVGFDEYAKRVREYPLSKVAEITTVPEDKIRQAALMIAKYWPSTLYHRMGTNMNTNNVQNLRAIDCLYALTGSLDVPGGNLLPSPSKFPRPASFYSIQSVQGGQGGQPPAEIRALRPGAKEWPINYGPDSTVSWLLDLHPHKGLDYLIDGRIKMAVWSMDPVMGLQNSAKVIQAIKSLEMSVALEHFMAPTAQISDYVLPVATWLERDWIHDTHFINYVSYGPKVVNPPGEVLDEREVGGRFCRALGVKTFIDLSSEKNYNSWRLRPMSITVEELEEKHCLGPWEMEYKKYEDVGFQTDSWKVEFSSSLLEKYGYDPLPSYAPPANSLESEYAKDFPLVFLSGCRNVEFMHSAHRNMQLTRQSFTDPYVSMHPDTARSNGVKEGEWVWISTPFSEERGIRPIRQRVHITTQLKPGVVHAMSHWYYPENEKDESQWLEFNVNAVVTDQAPYDPISGSPMIRGGLCRIRKMREEDRWECMV
jgi:thiosulfate reductase / polysulfide reductase chain A